MADCGGIEESTASKEAHSSTEQLHNQNQEGMADDTKSTNKHNNASTVKNNSANENAEGYSRKDNEETANSSAILPETPPQTVHNKTYDHNDSGIVMEKSPEASTSTPNTQNSSGDKAKESSSNSTTSVAKSIDISDLEDSRNSEDIDADMDKAMSSTCIDDDDKDSEVPPEVVSPIDSDRDAVDHNHVRKKVKQRHDSSSNDSSSTSGPDEPEVEEENQEEEEVEIDISVPNDTWRPVQSIIKREQGFSNAKDNTRVFQQESRASINLVRRLKKYCQLDKHNGCVNALHFNKSGTLLASGSDDLKIIVWDWANQKSFIEFDSGHRSNVFQSKFMPYSGDTHIVSCARDGHVRLAEMSSTGLCKSTKKLAQHKGGAHKLALLEDSSHIFYSCGEDAVVYEVDIRQAKANKLCVTKENDRKVPLYSIHSNPFKSHEFCVGGRDHFIRIYDKRMLDANPDESSCVKKYCPHHLMNADAKANVTCAVYNWNGTEVLGTYNDDDIYLFNNEHSDGAEYIHRYKGHRNNATVKGVNFYGPKSDFVVSGSDCGHVFLWEKESEKIVTYMEADEGGVINVLEPHPSSPFLATSGLDHDIKIWLPTSEEPTSLTSLKEVVKKNKRDREEERSMESDMFDSHMMWMLLQRLRRSARRQARGDDADGEGSSDTEGPDSDDEDSDDSGDMGERPQCVPM